MTVVGVFGISGAGKTTLISEVVRCQPTWQRVSAGSLIQEYLPDVERDALRALSQGRILDNQEAIVRGLFARRRDGTSEVVLFDGHVLIESEGLAEVPLDVIRRLMLDAMLFVHDAPDQIARRRQSDQHRSRAERSIEEIDRLQARECAIVERYARKLGIPFTGVTPSQREYLISFVRQRLNP